MKRSEGPTDLTLLRSLLDEGKKHLTTGEETAFRRMLEDLEVGGQASLSKNQRLWAIGRYNELKLDQVYKNKVVPKVKLLKPKSSGPTIWEQPKVLKPPGRK